MSEFYIPTDIDVLKIDLTEHDKKVRADVIDECISSIVNTPSKIGTHLKEPQKVDTCLTMLADRQIEIIDILNQLKE